MSTGYNDCVERLSSFISIVISLRLARETYLDGVSNLLLPSLFNQFRSTDFPFCVPLFNFIDSCTERYGRQNIVGRSSILDICSQYIMGNEVRGIRFPIMGAKFHLRSRDIVVQALVT
jgi:hypothetical protein